MRNEFLKASAVILAIIVVGCLVTYNILPTEPGPAAGNDRPAQEAMELDLSPDRGTVTYASDDDYGRVSYTGDLVNGQLAGQGAMTWKNGSRYEGQWRHGRMHGRGTLTYAPDDERGRDAYTGGFVDGRRGGEGTLIWKNGAKYEGQWRDDQRHGQGRLIEATGQVRYDGDFTADRIQGRGTAYYLPNDYIERVSYTGDFVNGKHQGQGTMTWKNGRKYEGPWLNDQPHGRGVMTYGPGDERERVSYTGDFVNGKREGRGTLTWKDGSEYEGQWRNDSQHGYGTLTYAPGDERGRRSYAGNFADGLRHGQGVLVWKNGRRYEGRFSRDMRQGQGIFLSSTGLVRYDGDYVSDRLHGRGTINYLPDDYLGRLSYSGDLWLDKRQGQGTLIWKDGRKYEGQWRDDRPHGYGVMTYGPDDDRERVSYAGDFVNGKRQGQGAMTWKSGERYEGQWRDDQPHGCGIMAFAPDDHNGRTSYAGGFIYGRRHGRGVMIWKDGRREEGVWQDNQFYTGLSDRPAAAPAE